MSLIESNSTTSNQEELRSALIRVAKSRVFFAHQSVGDNIINGISELSGLFGIPIDILEYSQPAPDPTPAFVHARVGYNGNPASKLEHFAQLLDSGVGESVDVAILKFCYVDVTAATDTYALYHHYRQLLDTLGSRYPQLNMIHCTIPLTARRDSIKARIVWTLRGKDSVKADNRSRTAFNHLLRKHYEYDPLLFDLAQLETGTTFYRESRPEPTTEFLHRTYTDDGGHLNQLGRKIIAEALVRKLGKLLH